MATVMSNGIDLAEQRRLIDVAEWQKRVEAGQPAEAVKVQPHIDHIPAGQPIPAGVSTCGRPE